MSEQKRYAYFERLIGSVDETVAKIRDLPVDKCYDAEYLEKDFI